ncbi:DUF222 domain-containing protein [Rhodococcus sp. G-MC3]|uniref:HNH endonuclease n=1 Tax=Rhodococcus sp. G-MC3 TaxID=3046209 RepID=UPI0024BB90B5|nr:HNH endonuclease signature motif containing protein [Rhodococcus sp. G-MC3]MDJ0395657.1 DUF222 domain-containing protein [Rhodococcus sp. G-MC3]
MQKLGDDRSADALSDQEIVSGITELTHAENSLAAKKYALLAQFSRRGINVGLKYSTPGRWLAAGTRVTHGNGDRQFDVANWASQWPAVTNALADGDIHLAHVNAIYDGFNHVRTCDPTSTAEALAAVVTELLSIAFDSTAGKVMTRSHEVGLAAGRDARERYEQTQREQQRREEERRDAYPDHDGPDRNDTDDHHTDDDGPNPEDDGPQPGPVGPPPPPVSENPALNKLDMYLQANGRTVLKGDLDKVLAEKLRAVLSPLSKPQPAPDGTRDPRNSSQRNADALSRHLDHDPCTGTRQSGPARPHVNVVVNLGDLMKPGRHEDAESTVSKTASSTTGPDDGDSDSGEGTADIKRTAPSMGDLDWPFNLEWTGPISHSLAQLLSCDAHLTPIIVDDAGVPLAMGRTVRLATPEQRNAVIVRDRCCVMCGRPARWCQVHHLTYWQNGGATDLTNLALVCGDCHRRVHQEGWALAMGKDGHPFVIPPATNENPERKPRPSYHRRREPAA